MNIMLMAFGSRGDIQPFLALAVALRDRGHRVTLAAPKDFEELIGSYEVTYLPIPISANAMRDFDSAQQITKKGVTPGSLLAIWREMVPQIKRAMLKATQDIAEVSGDVDLLIAHGFQMPFAYAIHQHLKIPLILSIAAPTIVTREFPIFPPLPFIGRFYNPLTYRILLRMMYFFTTEPTNTYRQSVGLPTTSTGEMIRLFFSGQVPTLMHYSRHISPAPSDWGENIKVMGTWPLPKPKNWTPPEKLSAFLADGEPPIFFGFGSMPVADTEQMTKTISEALRMTNLRGVLQAGWAGLSYEDTHLITIGDVPHSWLFPQMSAIVHHGGSGTTHSALWAGKPALIVPFMADQPFWARRIVELGVGVPPIAPKRLTPDGLAAALRTLTQDNAMRQRAAELGAVLHAENGLARACDFIESYVN